MDLGQNDPHREAGLRPVPTKPPQGPCLHSRTSGGRRPCLLCPEQTVPRGRGAGGTARPPSCSRGAHPTDQPLVPSTSTRADKRRIPPLESTSRRRPADEQPRAEMYAPLISKTNHSLSPNASNRNTNFVFICTAYVPRPKQCIKKDLRQPIALIAFIHCSITRAQ